MKNRWMTLYRPSLWPLLLVFFMTAIVLFISCWTPIVCYRSFSGMVEEDLSIVVPVANEDLVFFLKSKTLRIDHQQYHYSVERIAPDSRLEGEHLYREIYLHLELPFSQLVPYYTFSFSIFMDEKSLFQMLIDSWKER